MIRAILFLTIFFTFSVCAESTCRHGFIVESLRAYGDDHPEAELKGKVEIGVLWRGKILTRNVIGYARLNPGDPIVSVLKDAYFNQLEFELCVDAKSFKEIADAEKCKTCTARGEIQDAMRIYSASYLSPLKASKR